MSFFIYFFKRTLATIPLLFAITIVAFTLIQVMPGDYASQWKSQIMALGGVSEKDAEVQAQEIIYKNYFQHKKYRKPFIAAKIACSNDFFISSKNKFITNKHSRDVSHILRYNFDSILIVYLSRLNLLIFYFYIDEKLNYSTKVLSLFVSLPRKNPYHLKLIYFLEFRYQFLLILILYQLLYTRLIH